MLGWWIVVTREGEEAGPQIAAWEASIDGLAWLDELVAAGKAEQTSWNGYPNLFHANAGDVFSLIKNGPPRHTAPLVIGDDYVSKGGLSGKFRLDLTLASACLPEDRLSIQSWDQS